MKLIKNGLKMSVFKKSEIADLKKDGWQELEVPKKVVGKNAKQPTGVSKPRKKH